MIKEKKKDQIRKYNIFLNYDWMMNWKKNKTYTKELKPKI